MKLTRVIAPFVLFGAAVACGTEANDLDVSLEAPAPAEARVSISAAIEVSDLIDRDLADRVVIDDITVNLAEVRLLAADPRIPPGGLSLLSRETLLEFYGAEDSKLELPFPEQFLTQDDLAIYIHIAPSVELDDASIVVTGRYYAKPVGGQRSLKASGGEVGATDPDGDPVMPGEPEETAHGRDHGLSKGERECATDPDGDPVMCDRRMLVGETEETEESVSFVLRTSDVADLVATLGSQAALDVVVGIPGSRWFTQDVVDSFDRALVEAQREAATRENEKRSEVEDVIVVDSAERATSDRMRRADRDDYFVTNRDLDDLKVRR